MPGRAVPAQIWPCGWGLLERAGEEYGIATERSPLDGVVALVMMIAQGAQTDRLLGIRDGHAELLAWIDGWLQSPAAVWWNISKKP